MRSTRSAIAAIGWLSLLTGCHVYHPGRDQLAKQVQKDFTDLHLSTSLDDERKLSAELLDAELKGVVEHGEAQRDRDIAMLLDARVAGPPPAAPAPKPDGGRGKPDAAAAVAPAAPPAPAPKPGSTQVSSVGDFRFCPIFSRGQPYSLVCVIDGALERLVGGAPDTIAKATAALPSLEQDVSATIKDWRPDVLASELRAVMPALDCTKDNVVLLETLDVDKDPTFASLSATHRTQLDTLLDLYIGPNGPTPRAGGQCPRLLEAREVVDAGDGEIHAVAMRIKAMEDSLAAAQRTAQQLTRAYEAAAKEYEVATAVEGPTEKQLRDIEETAAKVNKSLGDLQTASANAATALGELGNPLEIAHLEAEVSSATLALKNVLSKASTTYETSAAKPLVEALIANEHIQRDAALPLLLLKAEVSRGKLARAKAAADAGVAGIAALKEKRAALQRAAAELGAARLKLHSGGNLVCLDPLSTQTVGTVLTKKPTASTADVDKLTQDERCQRAVAAAVLHYANAWTIGFIPARRAERLHIGILQGASLDASLASLEMWERVLAIPVAQIVEYHAGGTKSEQVAELVTEALGFAGLIGTTAAAAAK